VSSRDTALDYLSAASICAVHLSRLGGELVLWSSAEFGFCEPADDFSSGSSIMPQKKNPDAAELLRAKAPRIASGFNTLAGVLHGLPLAYSKDLQEDKEALFDAVDNLELSLEAARTMLAGMTFDRERMAEAAADEFPAATDIADLLVRKGMPFREAHGVVTPEEIRQHSELLDDAYYEVLESGQWLESKVSAGGTASARVADQLEAARAALAKLRDKPAQ
jgi:argininosuccinate lyase